MKNALFLLCLILLLCNGCKFFKKSSSRIVDTITADTTPENAGIVDSAALYTGIGYDTEKQTATPGVSRNKALSGKYFMIVGCFNVQSNADKFAEKLRGMGYEAQIISGKDNFQMVAAKSYDSYRESVADIDKFRNEVTPNAWVYLQK